MAFQIVWTAQAREDLSSIVRFIAMDNPTAAEAFGYLLISKVELLANHPHLGRIVPECGEEMIREIIVRPYRVVYRVAEGDKTIAVARIWHAARGEPEIPPTLENV